mmetsp:Transcript_19451/g.48710  ORF Transcript_19451/g.48710 Transcript_19451/m.48710 type:complete len:259 (+) Transcript_19451:2072-2848(+)
MPLKTEFTLCTCHRLIMLITSNPGMRARSRSVMERSNVRSSKLPVPVSGVTMFARLYTYTISCHCLVLEISFSRDKIRACSLPLPRISQSMSIPGTMIVVRSTVFRDKLHFRVTSRRSGAKCSWALSTWKICFWVASPLRFQQSWFLKWVVLRCAISRRSSSSNSSWSSVVKCSPGPGIDSLRSLFSLDPAVPALCTTTALLDSSLLSAPADTTPSSFSRCVPKPTGSSRTGSDTPGPLSSSSASCLADREIVSRSFG